MHSVVCIKQVPDTAEISVDPINNTIKRRGVPAVTNPYDKFALEEALRLKDRFGGRVTALSMGARGADAVLREAIAYGADEGILVSDKAFAGADTLATTYVLASSIRQIQKQGPVDVVFTGKQTIDGDTAQVGPGIAQRLNMPLLSYVAKLVAIDPERQTIVVERRAEHGVQRLSTELPCVITMLEDSNEMRYASMPGMFRAARAEIPTWNRDAAGIADISKVGLKGSPTMVKKVFTPPVRADAVVMIGSDGATVDEIAESLIARLADRVPAMQGFGEIH